MYRTKSSSTACYKPRQGTSGLDWYSYVSTSPKTELSNSLSHLGIFQRSTVSTDDQSLIESECLEKWSTQSSTQILGIFLFYLLPSTIYSLVVYTYYRQCLDPLHAASLYTQTLTHSGRHPYARLANEPPTAYSARLLRQFSAALPVFGHYQNGMCARHRPDGSLIVPKDRIKGEKREESKHQRQSTTRVHSHCNHHPSGSGSRSASPRSNRASASARSASKRLISGRRTRIRLERTRSDWSDGSMVTVSPGPPSYSGVVYDATYSLGEYDTKSAGAEGKFIN